MTPSMSPRRTPRQLTDREIHSIAAHGFVGRDMEMRLCVRAIEKALDLQAERMAERILEVFRAREDGR